LSPEEHAEAHKQLYEKFGKWQDYLAWKGLSKIFSHDDCIRFSIIEGAKQGAAMTNQKRWENHSRKERKYPKGTDGRKVRSVRYWYHDGVTEGQFELGQEPDGWSRGRLKGKYGGHRKVSGLNRIDSQ
jgi:hypothetical protein